MKNHWDKHLKVKDLIIKYKPKLIVELGAGGGENTDQYLQLREKQPFKMIVISDGNCPDRYLKLEDFEWRFAISYKELLSFEDGSIDFCSIDTDHNYWTLQQELEQLVKKMKKGGIVVLHDTESYRHNSGVMPAYNTGDPYPNEIKALQDRGMGDALDEQIKMGNFKLIKHIVRSCGATAIEKI